VVVAAPADQAACMLRQSAPELSSILSEIEYAPIAVVGLGYSRQRVQHSLSGFGFMVPRREKMNVFYNVWNSSMCPGRAPEGKVLLTSFAGGATNREFVSQSEEDIAREVETEIGRILGTDGAPVERFVWKLPKALPLMNVGHAKRVEEIRESAAQLPGISLIGNYLEGRSLGDCLEVAFQTAANVGRQFKA
jgi:protoporphyrinogen/coproporphyrinogen III oxidase